MRTELLVEKIYKFRLWMLKMAIYGGKSFKRQAPTTFIPKNNLEKSERVLIDLRKSLNVLCYGNTQGDKREEVYLGRRLSFA